MKIEWLIGGILFYGGLYALYYYLKAFVNTSVEKSIAHQFDIKLETFKQEFTKDLHAIDRKDKYRLVALERRLEAHQKAFMIAWKMISSLYSPPKIQDEVRKLWLEFMYTQSLYLTNEARTAFMDAYSAYIFYSDSDDEIRELRRKGLKEEIAKVRENQKSISNKIKELPNIILRGVDLEAMANDVTIFDKRIGNV